MSFNVSFIVKAVDSFSAPMQKVKATMDSIKEKADKADFSIKKLGKSMKSLGGDMSLKLTAPFAAFGAIAVKTAGDMESMNIAFGTMLGSEEKAAKLMQGLISYAAKTPFEMPEIGQAARVLLAFNVSAENVLPTLKRLGDIAAGANIPINELSLIFGKVLSKGKLQAEELNQMSERGIPIMSFLEKILGKSKAEIYQLGEQGKLSSKYVVDAFAAMTDEGGIFYNMTEKQSRSINGLISTMRDNLRLASATFGNIIVDVFKLRDAIPSLSSNIESFAMKVEFFAKTNPELTKFILGAIAFVAIGGPLIATLGLVALGIGAILSPIGLVVIAIAALVAGLTYLYYKWDSFKSGLKSLFGIKDTISQIGSNPAILKSANQSALSANSGILSPIMSDISGYSSADVNINIADKNNNVSAIKTSRFGNMNLNVGKNMSYISG